LPWPVENDHDDHDDDHHGDDIGFVCRNDPSHPRDRTNDWQQCTLNVHLLRTTLHRHRHHHHHRHRPHRQTPQSSPTTAIQTRSYHATPPKPILPFLAAGIVGLGAVYTFRALRQMDEDWEEYRERVEEYERATGMALESDMDMDMDMDMEMEGEAKEGNAAEDVAAHFRQGTLAVDMGSARLKLAHRPQVRKRGDAAGPAPSVGVDREGGRSTPNWIWFEHSDSNSDSEGGNVLFGRLAASHHVGAIHPREALYARSGPSEALAVKSAREAIRIAASDALDQILGGGIDGRKQTDPLFVLDPAIVSGTAASYNVRPVLTHPPDAPAWYLERYRKAIDDLTAPPGIALFVPEPVAAVAGADYYKLLPPVAMSAKDSVLVVDVGGKCTTISLVTSSSSFKTNDVHTKEVMYSATLPSLGGDTFIDLLVGNLIQSFYGRDPYHHDGHGRNDAETDLTTTAATAPPTPPSSKPTLPNDPQALQRLYESSTTAVHELSRKSRSHINIPYLTMDLQSRQPRHLDVGVARSVVESEVDSFVSRRLVPYYSSLRGTTSSSSSSSSSSPSSSSSSSSSSVLSNAVPPPKDLTTLLSSAIMSALEQTHHTPFQLRGILLVGGGARIPMIRRAMKETVEYLTGGDGILVVPEGEMLEELGVLGAVVWGSGAK
ncbi:hypothetical protein ACHAXS_003757, partial [Conticribra weissflogii]